MTKRNLSVSEEEKTRLFIIVEKEISMGKMKHREMKYRESKYGEMNKTTDPARRLDETMMRRKKQNKMINHG